MPADYKEPEFSKGAFKEPEFSKGAFSDNKPMPADSMMKRFRKYCKNQKSCKECDLIKSPYCYHKYLETHTYPRDVVDQGVSKIITEIMQCIKDTPKETIITVADILDDLKKSLDKE
jgi:hypothetical protein